MHLRKYNLNLFSVYNSDILIQIFATSRNFFLVFFTSVLSFYSFKTHDRTIQYTYLYHTVLLKHNSILYSIDIWAIEQKKCIGIGNQNIAIGLTWWWCKKVSYKHRRYNNTSKLLNIVSCYLLSCIPWIYSRLESEEKVQCIGITNNYFIYNLCTFHLKLSQEKTKTTVRTGTCFLYSAIFVCCVLLLFVSVKLLAKGWKGRIFIHCYYIIILLHHEKFFL